LAGTWFGAFTHSVATQAFDMPLLALLTGVLLRCYARGWDRSLLTVVLPASIGIALTRHASIVFTTMVPAYWTILGVIAVLGRKPVRAYAWNAAIAASVVVATLVVSSAATDLACYAYKEKRQTSDCTRVYGRAGTYRLLDTLALIPRAEREAWFARQTSGLSAAQAFALRAMATSDGPWMGGYVAIKKAYPQENTDRLMNSAFFHFAMSLDRYSVAQMMVNFRAGLSLGRSNFLGNGRLRDLLVASAQTVSTDVNRDLREQLGTKGAIDGPRLAQLSASPLVAAYDRFTINWLNWVALTLFLLAGLIKRTPAVMALGLAMVTTAVTYVFMVSAATVIISAYVLPVNFLMYVLTGTCLCVLLEPEKRGSPR
jgi:hypothetical protein